MINTFVKKRKYPFLSLIISLEGDAGSPQFPAAVRAKFSPCSSKETDLWKITDSEIGRNQGESHGKIQSEKSS